MKYVVTSVWKHPAALDWEKMRQNMSQFKVNPNVLTSYGLSGTGLLVLTGSITDQFGNEPAQTSDASGPHPDFDGSFFATTA